MVPTLGAIVVVVTSSPATGELCSTPGTFRTMSFTSSQNLVGALQARTRWQDDDDRLVADVLIRNEARRHAATSGSR